MRLRRAMHRMVAGIDPHHGGNRTKFSDCRINDISIVHDIGIVTDTTFRNTGSRADFRIASEDGSLYFRGRIDQRFNSEFLSHHVTLSPASLNG